MLKTRVILFSVLCFLFQVSGASAVEKASPGPDGSPGIRALFDEQFFWLTREGADTLVETAKATGFNVIIPCVWHGRGVSWPSRLLEMEEPKWSKVKKNNPDPLAYLIDKAHQEGLEVHPWFTVTLKQGDFPRKYYDEGTPKKHFNPHLPEFRKFILDLMLEVVKNYAVDGINLDYIRTGGLCESRSCKDDYYAKTGRNLKLDTSIYRYSREARESIRSWNSSAITEIVRDISGLSRKLRPGISITADTVVGNDWWALQGADGIRWANEDLVDIIYHMDYEDALLTDQVVKQKVLLKEPDKLAYLISNYKFLTPNEAYRRPAPINRRRVDAKLKAAFEALPDASAIGVYEYRFIEDKGRSFFR